MLMSLKEFSGLYSDAMQKTEVLKWMSKALFFDIRKGSNSVGSSVRDAASYVLWSLARTRKKEALQPFATTLAQKLVVVSLFDREVHIRRAASAAFQEHVGRMVCQMSSSYRGMAFLLYFRDSLLMVLM